MMHNIYKNSETLGFYIAGLFEGDGHLILPAASSKHNPRWHVTFHIKDKYLAHKLLDNISYGFIRYKTKENACVLTVSPVKGLKKLVSLINGKLKTPKIHQLHLLIDWLNKHHEANITKLPVFSGPINGDAWLAGFIDADGSFGIRSTKKAPGIKQKIACRFRLEQRMTSPVTGESYKDILTLIGDYCGVSLKTRKQKSTQVTYYLIEVSSRAGIRQLQNYLDRYHLISSKLLDYYDWCKVAKMLVDQPLLLPFCLSFLLLLQKQKAGRTLGKRAKEMQKAQYTPENLAEIDRIKKNMNMRRKVFQWDHLDCF